MESIIRRKQLTRLGEILRLSEDHPDRICCFQPGTDLRVRIPHGTHRRVGRPRATWAETLLPLCESIWFMNRAAIETLAQNREAWYLAVERLCSLV